MSVAEAISVYVCLILDIGTNIFKGTLFKKVLKASGAFVTTILDRLFHKVIVLVATVDSEFPDCTKGKEILR